MQRHASILVFITACTLCAVALLPSATFAHETGLTLTATTRNYYIDVDYEDFAVFAGTSGRFDLNLYKDESRTQPVSFSQVWVRITNSQNDTSNPLFSGRIQRAAFGSTGFAITLPSPGIHNLSVRFEESDTQLAEADLSFTVEPNPNASRSLSADLILGCMYGVLAAALVAAGIWYSSTALRRRR